MRPVRLSSFDLALSYHIRKEALRREYGCRSEGTICATMHKLRNRVKTNIVLNNTALNSRREPLKKMGWKWQEASLTSHQTKLNKTFPLRQRAGKTSARIVSGGENFSCLSFSSACTSLELAFLKQRQIIISISILPAVQRSLFSTAARFRPAVDCAGQVSFASLLRVTATRRWRCTTPAPLRCHSQSPSPTPAIMRDNQRSRSNERSYSIENFAPTFPLADKLAWFTSKRQQNGRFSFQWRTKRALVRPLVGSRLRAGTPTFRLASIK